MTSPAATAEPSTSPLHFALQAPGLWRRMACFIYEGVLLFGVLMIAGYLFSTLTQQRNALIGRHGLQAFLFVVLAIYFVWFWSHGGQTVAMRAWQIRLVDLAGRPISQARGLARYLVGYLWFAPALLWLQMSGLNGAASSFGILLAGVVAYALVTKFHPQRQFFHDVVCGTRLIDHRVAASKHR